MRFFAIMAIFLCAASTQAQRPTRQELSQEMRSIREHFENYEYQDYDYRDYYNQRTYMRPPGFYIHRNYKFNPRYTRVYPNYDVCDYINYNKPRRPITPTPRVTESIVVKPLPSERVYPQWYYKKEPAPKR